jgi:hypothetical protein
MKHYGLGGRREIVVSWIFTDTNLAKSLSKSGSLSSSSLRFGAPSDTGAEPGRAYTPICNDVQDK